MLHFPPRLLAAAIAVLSVAALAACSDDGGDDGDGTGSADGPIAGDDVPAEIQVQPNVVQELDDGVTAAVGGIIDLAAADALFSPNNLSVTTGESVVIRVSNSDTDAHNVRVAGIDGQYATEDDAVTVPESIANGETGELNFSPLVPGDYTFRCDFHPGSMGGQVVVQ